MRRLKIEHKEKLKGIIKKAVNKGDEVLKAVVLYMIAEGRYAKEIAKELGISERVYLPPYSPDLNPIEWIFKSIKRVVSVAFVKSK